MSLQQWHENGWLTKAEPSSAEVSNLLGIAEREIADASLKGISPDGRFQHAYDAVRALCEVALHASGYALSKGQGQHERVIESLTLTLGGEWVETADFFQHCRRMRHQMTYERPGITQGKDADDLLDAAKQLLVEVRAWLEHRHPDLI